MDQLQNNAQQQEMVVSPKIKLSSREFFLWVGIVVSLYASISAILTIIFTSLNKIYPDSLDYGSYYQGSGISMLSTPLSIVVVLFPIFTILSYFANSVFKKNPERAALGFRKFVIWLTLFLSTAMVATDLIVLIHYFLNGEVTTRFLIKVIVILLTAILLVSYYYYDLRRDVRVYSSKGKMYGVLAWLIVVATIVFAFSVFGSPQNQRGLTLDFTRIERLNQIEQGVARYWQDHGKMPEAITDISNYVQVQDPESATGKMFEYHLINGTAFEVCAVFTTDSPNTNNGTYAIYQNDSFLPKGIDNTNPWKHGSGRTCFARVIDTDQFPVRPELSKNTAN